MASGVVVSHVANRLTRSCFCVAQAVDIDGDVVSARQALITAGGFQMTLFIWILRRERLLLATLDDKLRADTRAGVELLR